MWNRKIHCKSWQRTVSIHIWVSIIFAHFDKVLLEDEKFLQRVPSPMYQVDSIQIHIEFISSTHSPYSWGVNSIETMSSTKPTGGNLCRFVWKLFSIAIRHGTRTKIAINVVEMLRLFPWVFIRTLSAIIIVLMLVVVVVLAPKLAEFHLWFSSHFQVYHCLFVEFSKFMFPLAEKSDVGWITENSPLLFIYFHFWSFYSWFGSMCMRFFHTYSPYEISHDFRLFPL